MVSVQALANSILKRSFEESIVVTPMKLQKLLYFIYRDYLKNNHEPLFGENFQVWQYGPVLSSVYDEFKSFRASPIDRFAKDAQDRVFVINEKNVNEVGQSINRVWEKYKMKDGIELSKMTHEPGTAWDKAYKDERSYLKDEDILDEAERTTN